MNWDRRGHPFSDGRRVVEAIIHHYRTGDAVARSAKIGVRPWQTLRNRHRHAPVMAPGIGSKCNC